MVKAYFLMSILCMILPKALTAGGAESLPFHGYLPSEMILALAPEADSNPNDVYKHLPVRRPTLQEDQIVIYPHHLGFEYGQDPEHKIYEVHNAKELAAKHKHEKHSKHDKHGKHHKDHHHHHSHEDQSSPKDFSSNVNGPIHNHVEDHDHSHEHAAPHTQTHNYAAPPPQHPNHIAPQGKPSFPPKHPSAAYPPPPPRPQNGYGAPSVNSIPSPGGRPPYPYQQKPVFPPRG